MKLIELLARELKEWPDAKAAIAVQDGDRAQTIKFGGVDANPSIALMGKENVWQSEDWKCPASIDFDCFELASDWRTAIVTREQWESTQATPGKPTLETMLTEWRDLEARAQAAQAEADALFEHASQCHGEIVVRLADLGWGAPRGPMVPGEPVVTFDKGGWIDWEGGECPVTDGTIIDTKYRNGDLLTNGECGTFGTKTSREFWKHENHPSDIVAYRITPSTQQ